jgi:hypothetical protein
MLSPELARLFKVDRTLYSPLMRLSIYPTSDDRLCRTCNFYLHFDDRLGSSRLYTVKKGSRVSRPQAGCHNQTLPGRE